LRSLFLMPTGAVN